MWKNQEVWEVYRDKGKVKETSWVAAFLRFGIFFRFDSNGGGKKMIEIASMKYEWDSKDLKARKPAELKVSTYSSHM